MAEFKEERNRICTCGHHRRTHHVGVCFVTDCDCFNYREADGKKTFGWTGMACERCREREPILYRVTSDILDLLVCELCAETATELGLQIESMRPDTRGPADAHLSRPEVTGVPPSKSPLADQESS